MFGRKKYIKITQENWDQLLHKIGLVDDAEFGLTLLEDEACQCSIVGNLERFIGNHNGFVKEVKSRLSKVDKKLEQRKRTDAKIIQAINLLANHSGLEMANVNGKLEYRKIKRGK